ncbi:MAG: AbrB/MazE/SpoVT family DNA-binding domain-containing protein [Pseudomonadota bacterium]|nr:AbrB/MazE/SpoVT family DNA-binding domain-containing protein [Pseudomonadota bacterium]MDE3038646.1 AbrB/MazE/SpoVT family DNA-binding domain-containing protein [Pseudomonadota bacterium]
MTTLKITTIGNSVGVILSKELLTKLHVDKGDTLYATDIPGGIELRPYDTEFVNDMDMVDRIIGENRNVLRKLADN